MNHRQWFGIGVRLLGVWEILYGADELIGAAFMSAGMFHPGSFSDVRAYFCFAAFHLIAGFVLIKGAPVFTIWLYPASSPHPDVAHNSGSERAK